MLDNILNVDYSIFHIQNIVVKYFFFKVFLLYVFMYNMAFPSS